MQNELLLAEATRTDTNTWRRLVYEIKECGKRSDLQGGRRLHCTAIRTGCYNNRYIANTLISMYSKCGSMEDARYVFEKMVEKNTVSWNSLLLGYVQNGQNSAALYVFSRMNCTPNSLTFVTALKACTSFSNSDKESCLETGTAIHERARECGFHRDVFVASLLVEMYRKCGRMNDARCVFESATHRDVVLCTALILGYVENGFYSDALEVFTNMSSAPNSLTFVSALKACVGLACIEKGMAIHKQAKERGFDKDVFVANALVEMYSKCGCMWDARCVFERMLHRDIVSWTSLILGYVENGDGLMALEVLNRIEFAPDTFIYVAALKACGSLACVEKGMAIHREVTTRGVHKSVFLTSILVDMYSKCGSMRDARTAFESASQHDVVTWNSLILGYVENGEIFLALEVFCNMECAPNNLTFVAALKACVEVENGMAIHGYARERGVDGDVYVANTLVDVYCKCGCVRDARDVFDTMQQRGVVSWNALMLGYVESGEGLTAIELFAKMDCEPDSVTYVAVLKACSSVGALETGERVHKRIRELELERYETVGTSLVDFYGKCGRMCAAEEALERIRYRSTASWNALIGGYASVGDTAAVFTTVRRLQEAKVRMNAVTFLLVLAACSHAGMIEEGERYFVYMTRYGIRPGVEHYTCMVDMLGRVNRLQEALVVLNGMPFDAHAWMSFLGACRKWSCVKMAKVAFDTLVAHNEDVAAAYVLMGNVYRRLGMQQQEEEDFHQESNVRKYTF